MIRYVLAREYAKWQAREVVKIEKQQVAEAFLDEVLADGSVRYVMVKTVREHKRKVGHKTYVAGRIQISTSPELIGKKVVIIILTPPVEKTRKS